MKFLRDPDAKRCALLLLAFTVVCCTAAAVLFGLRCAAFTLLCSAAFCAAFFLFTLRRYRRLEELAASIDLVLHGACNISFDAFSEGEISVLRDEIIKLTVSLRERTDALSREKARLADSMADISHQLRTPLTSVNIILSTLRRDGLTDERRRELLAELCALVSRTDWLVSAMLKLSKLDADAVRFAADPVELSDLVRHAAEPLAVALELRGVSLVTDVCGSFTGDLSWTAEAVGNIIKNCMEHTPEGGTVTVTGRETAVFSELVISDTGDGISAKDMPHIFERFYRGAGSAPESAGIGLALARKIITAQNGTIKAENRSTPTGARFTVRLYKTTI